MIFLLILPSRLVSGGPRQPLGPLPGSHQLVSPSAYSYSPTSPQRNSVSLLVAEYYSLRGS